MRYSDFKLETAREIIKNCEEYQQGNDSAYAKQQEQLSAYRQLRELLLPGTEEM